MQIDRSKYSSTPADEFEKVTKNLETGRDAGDEWFSWKNASNGTHVFKLLPGHYIESENRNTSAVQRFVTSWFSIPNPDTGKLESRRIFNAKSHLDKSEFDPVAFYIDTLVKQLKEHKVSGEKFKEIMLPVNKMTTDSSALKPQVAAVSYVLYLGMLDEENGGFTKESEPEFFSMEYKPSMRNQLVELMHPTTRKEGKKFNDIFSHPDTGVCLFITKNDQADSSGYYKLSADNELWATPDEFLEELEQHRSLEEKCHNTYSVHDLIAQGKGLRYFDQKHGHHIFDRDDFKIKMQESVAWFTKKEWDEALGRSPIVQEQPKPKELPQDFKKMYSWASLSKMNMHGLKGVLSHTKISVDYNPQTESIEDLARKIAVKLGIEIADDSPKETPATHKKDANGEASKGNEFINEPHVNLTEGEPVNNFPFKPEDVAKSKDEPEVFNYDDDLPF